MSSTPSSAPSSSSHTPETPIGKISSKIGKLIKKTSHSIFSIFNAFAYNKGKTIGQVGDIVKKIGHIGDDGVQTAHTWGQLLDNSWKETKASYGTVLEPRNGVFKAHIDDLETETENTHQYTRQNPGIFKRAENFIKRTATLPIKLAGSTLTAVGGTLSWPFAYLGMSDKKIYKPLSTVRGNRWKDTKSYFNDIFARNRGKEAQKEGKIINFVDQHESHSKAA